jgi:hypothetical protein
MIASFQPGDAHEKKNVFCNCRWCHANLVEEEQNLVHGRALVAIRCRHPALDYQFHSRGVLGYDVDVWTGPEGIGHDTEELKGWLSSWKENLSRELVGKGAKTLIATEKDLVNQPAVRMHSHLIYRPGIRPKVVRVLERKYVHDLHSHLYPSCHCMDPVYASPSKQSVKDPRVENSGEPGNQNEFLEKDKTRKRSPSLVELKSNITHRTTSRERRRILKARLSIPPSATMIMSSSPVAFPV